MGLYGIISPMTPEKKPVRVRLAPSPTGPLHIGTARTALFNLIFARQHKGAFLIRIEDTDHERSKPEFEKDIIDGLAWLGITPDEPPARQSERGELYSRHLKKLLADGLAYYCYCTKEELEAEKQDMMSQGLAPKYSGRCRTATPDSRHPQLIRLKTQEHDVSFHDFIRGKVTFDAGLIGDFPIAKNLDAPLYNFAVVVDDFDMKISHVIRGEDHIPNTPRQILIAEALGFSPPVYAHLPLLLSPQGGKLSKRDAELTTVSDYRAAGYLPAALINFISLLGWHPEGDSAELITLPELIKNFSLERVQKGGAVINQSKFDWLNAHYIQQMSDDDLLEAILPFVPPGWLEEKDRLRRAAHIEKERLKTLSDIKEQAAFIFKLPAYPPVMLLWKEMAPATALESLTRSLEIISGDPQYVEEKIVALSQELGRGEVFWPLRVALSGQKNSPPPLDIFFTLGPRESVRRLEIALAKLKELSSRV